MLHASSRRFLPRWREPSKKNVGRCRSAVMLSGEGLHPSNKGKRVRFDGRKSTVVDGPFAGAKELVAGFWIWQVNGAAQAAGEAPHRARAAAEAIVRLR
jgi:hypothetical protein